MKEQPITHFQNSCFKYKEKRLQIPQNIVYGNFMYTKIFYIREDAAVKLSKFYFLKNTKKTSKPK